MSLCFIIILFAHFILFAHLPIKPVMAEVKTFPVSNYYYKLLKCLISMCIKSLCATKHKGVEEISPVNGQKG